jgi:hypothetical protein
MGIFDIFKAKAEPPSPAQETPQAPEPYFGDLAKTQEIFRLLKTPHSERDDAWNQEFLSHLAAASFRCGNPQVITGPDGYPYVQLLMPEPGQSFQCYVIDRMKDDFLLERGFGVVINPTSGQPDWVLSYGDILNLHLSRAFYTPGETPFSSEVRDEVIKEAEEVMIGQPSAAILPPATRKLLSEYLALNGVSSPKVALMMRRTNGGAGVSQDLAFNLTPEQFTDEQTYRLVMQGLGWYLPRHYSFVGLNESALGDGFMPL